MWADAHSHGFQVQPGCFCYISPGYVGLSPQMDANHAVELRFDI